MKGIIEYCTVDITDGKLVVSCCVKCRDGAVYVSLPDNEIAALLPKDVFLKDRKKINREFLDLVKNILDRLTKGRKVEVEFNPGVGNNICHFEIWDNLETEESKGENI